LRNVAESAGSNGSQPASTDNASPEITQSNATVH
jgi:hypothetical protein